MPSPQSLVVFLLFLFVLLLSLRTQFGMSPTRGAVVAIFVSAVVAAAVEWMLPPDEIEDDEPANLGDPSSPDPDEAG